MATFVLESIIQFIKKPQDIFFNKILDFLSKNQIKGKLSENLLSIMIKNNIKASLVTFNTLLDLYITQNNYTMANHLFKSLNQKREPCPDNFTFSIMINGVKNMPNASIETAKEYYSQFVTQFGMDVIILNSFLEVCVTLGDFEQLDSTMLEFYS